MYLESKANNQQISINVGDKVITGNLEKLYLHWWSFLGMFGEIGEGLYSQVMSIRSKMAKGKKLDKTDKEFYNEHKEFIDLKVKLTAEEQAELDFINNLV